MDRAAKVKIIEKKSVWQFYTARSLNLKADVYTF